MPVPQPLRDAVRGLVRTPPPSPKRSQTPDGRRLHSAPRVILTVLVTLVVCALLDANSLVDTVSQERYGTSRSVELSLVRPFRTVSRWTGLDLPLRWLNDVRTSGHTAVTVAPEVAVPPPVTTLAPPAPVTVAPQRLRASTTLPVTTTIPPPPPRRVPTAADPLKVWLAGDSLMGDIAQSFEETYAGDPLIASSVNYQVGTGLARPDVYNWPAEVAQEVASAKPDVVIMIFGANDDQDMMVNGKRVVLGSPAWAEEYARRVNQIADEVVSPTRTLIWLEVPPTVRPQINTTDVVIDHALAVTAAAHPGMEVVNLAPPLTTATGGYTEYLPGSGGQPEQVRDADGVHITVSGANRVVPLIFGAIRHEWALPEYG
jgi:hypothetical protein